MWSPQFYLLMCVWIGIVASQNCNIQAGASYQSSDQNIVTLYNIPSAEACCSACSQFEDCSYFTYTGDSGSSLYQQCALLSFNSQATSAANGNIFGGSIDRPRFLFNSPCDGATQNGVDFDNGFLSNPPAADSSTCCSLCANYTGCNYWVFATDSKICYLKGINSNPISNSKLISGSTVPPPATLRQGKRGVAWFNSQSCSDLKLLNNVNWIYNWDYQPDGLLLKCINSLGLEYIPMVWGHLPINLNNVYTNSKYLLTFNEPNFVSQSNISPSQAAAQWGAIQTFAQKYGMKIGSPSASAGGDMMDPISWFDQFFASCSGCQVDFITTHIYTCNPVGVYNYLQSLTKYGKPIWLTEFACPGANNVTEEAIFMAETLVYLDNTTIFERYAWFGTRIAPSDTYLGTSANLFDSSSCSLSTVGRVYTSDYNFSSTTGPSTHVSEGMRIGFTVVVLLQLFAVLVCIV